MVSPFWSLFRVTLDTAFGLSAARYRYLVKKERLWEPILAGFGLVGAGVAFVFLLYQVARGFVAAGAQVGQPEVAFTFSLLVAMGLVFFFGLFAVISVFYFSTDLEVLVPLPLTPGSIVLAKFGAILVGEYVGVAVVFGPTAVAYAQAAGGGVGYWLSVLLVGLLAPVIPLALASAVSLLLMRFINRRHRDLLMIAFSVLLVALILGLQMTVLGSVPEEQAAAYLQRILSGQIRLVNLVGRRFPPAIWATNAIAAAAPGPRVASLAGFVGGSLAAVWVMGVIGGRVFYGGLIGGEELARRRLTARQAARARAEAMARTAQGGVLRALFWREWHLFMRVPLYVMNGFVASLIVPFFLLVPTLVRNPAFDSLVGLMSGTGEAAFYAELGLAALIVFLVGLNTTASSAVSREGKYFWISKVIPVTPEQQVQAKLLFSGSGALVSAVPVILVAGLAFRMGPARVVGASLLGLLGSLITLFLGLLFDMARPFLTWTNPQQAVKSNLNVIFPLPVVAVLFVGLGLLARWLYGGLGLSEAAVEGILIGVLVLGNLLSYRATVSAADRLYRRLDA